VWKRIGSTSRRLVLTVLVASSLATAAFAFDATVNAKQSGCCLVIAHCIGSICGPGEECPNGDYCCDPCPE
jgi:hypothetical protein